MCHLPVVILVVVSVAVGQATTPGGPDDQVMTSGILMELHSQFVQLQGSLNSNQGVQMYPYVHGIGGETTVNTSVTMVAINASSDWSIGLENLSRLCFIFTTDGNNTEQPSVKLCKAGDVEETSCVELEVDLRAIKTHEGKSYHIFETPFTNSVGTEHDACLLKFRITSQDPVVSVSLSSDVMAPMVFIYSDVLPSNRPTFQFAANTGQGAKKRRSGVRLAKTLSAHAPQVPLRPRRTTACALDGYNVSLTDIGVVNVVAPTGAIPINKCTSDCSSTDLTNLSQLPEYKIHTDVSIIAINSQFSSTPVPVFKCVPSAYSSYYILYTGNQLINQPNVVAAACRCM